MKAKLTKLFTLLTILTLGITNVWGQTDWTLLESVDFTNTTNFPAVTYLNASADVKATVNGVFFWSKKGSKALKVNDGVVGVDFGGQNISSSGQHGVAIPVTNVNGSLKVIVYHAYNNTSANFKVGISHEADNDPSKTQTFDQSPSNSGTKNKNDFVFTKTGLTGTDYIVWVGESSSSYTLFKRVEIYTEAPSCDATAPGNISKGALVAGELTLTAAGSPADKNVWYWQSSATGEDKITSGASITVTAAGTYYIRSLYDNDCWSDAKSFEVKATDLVANYTVIYKDGSEELKRETVEVGHTPDAYTPTKDCYTFANWDVDPSSLGSTAANAAVTLTASWTPNYAFGAYSFNSLTVGAAPSKTITTSEVTYADPFRVDNFYFDGGIKIQGEIGTDDEGLALNNYKGWKLKTTGKNIKFLVENNCQVKVAVGSANTLKVLYTALDGAAQEANLAQQTETPYLVKGGTIVTLQTTTGSTITLKRIEISALYDATLNDTKSDGSDSKTSVTEVTLPTPTAVSGWTYTGWKADKDVIDSEDNTQTAGTLLDAGTYTLLDNTTFTAQWTEVTGTYDITYVSSHGSAPAAANAGSVVLAEITGVDSWAHKGWTANVDVTVDAATVNAGDLIENGKTVILAGDVTFTAVWKEIFTVTFDSKDGSAVAPVDVEDGASLAAAPTAPTKDNYVFLGWSETDGGPVVADITTLTIGADKTLYAKWALDVQVTELVFSNSFKGWINGSNITVFYMAGESAPTIVSYEGKNLKAADAVAISGDEIVATGSDDSKKHYTLTMTAVSPLTTTGAKQTFDGTEGYVKSAAGWASDKGWKFQKLAADGRVARGLTREYFFFGPAESATFTWKVVKKNDGDPAVAYVYVDGVLATTITSKSTSDPVVVNLKNSNSIVEFESAQTNGDCGLMDVTLAPWVPTTGVTLKEGEDAISEKTIWAGTNFTLTAAVTPDDASDKTITWTSSNDAIATVVDGVVTGVAANATPATITATTVDGVYATCVVTVTAAPAPCETPTINTQPATQAYCAGSEPILTVDAGVTDGGTLHYAWFKDDAAIGSDAATCLVDGAGTYKVVVTNHVDGKLDASVTSDNAVITLNVAAAITTQPTNKSEIVSGSSVTLSLVATDATSYQWYSCDDAEKTNAAAISGAEAADYVFTCTANGYYYCEVGNACGAAVVSNVVSVKLEPEGCNVLDGTIPTAAPYIYDNSEWTLYAVTSAGKLDGSSRFKDAKDFDDNTVKVIEYGRVGMTFAKDVESLTFYATASSTGRTINSIKVTSDDITTGTPTYTDVDADLASATMPGQTKQYIFTADNMLLEAGKKYWIAFSGTVDIFKICYTEALAKPTIPTLSNQELCSGESYAEIDATSTKTGEGTLSYQWYNATDEEHPVVIDGANSATFTPAADGKYYVEVTNAAAGHVSNKAKSNTINVAHFAATEITTALENQRKDAGEEVTLAVVASGKNLHYAWKECATIDGTYTDVTGATDAPSLTVTVTAGMDKYYKVIVSSACGSAVESIARVEEWTELPQVDVTAATTWDMANVADVAINLKEDFNPSRQNERLLLANLKGVNNDATFNAQALMFEGQHIGRETNSVKHLAGRYLQFNVTVPGVVFVTFASNGDNQRTIRINANKCAETTNDGAYITFAAAVNPGSVEIMGIQDESENQYVRISKVEFRTTPDYTRDVSNNIGTLCVDHNVPAGGAIGATFYQLAGKEPTYGKLVFDEVTELVAGEPYIFQSNTGSIALYYGETVADNPVEVNHMIGSYVDTKVTITEDNKKSVMYISNNKLWDCSDYLDWTSQEQKLKVVANRAYIANYDAIEAPTSASPAPGRRRITVGKDGQNAATDVDLLNAAEAPVKMIIDGKMYILRGEKMYDATGRLVK